MVNQNELGEKLFIEQEQFAYRASSLRFCGLSSSKQLATSLTVHQDIGWATNSIQNFVQKAARCPKAPPKLHKFVGISGSTNSVSVAFGV